MIITRRSLLAGLGATALLSACRGGDVPLDPVQPAAARGALTPTTRAVVSSITQQPTRRVAGGGLALTDRIKTAPEYSFGEPEGGMPPDTQLSIDEAIGAMIRVSSNGAALALISRLGDQAVEAAPTRFGMADTTIDVQPGSDTGHYLVEAYGTARDYADFFLKLGRGQVVNRDLDARMAGYLLDQQVDDRLPALLPPGTPVAHKTGELDELTHDAGIVYLTGRPYVVAALAQAENGPAEGRAVVAEVSRILYGWYGGR